MQQQKSFQNNEQGKLYLVPTPIGNLEDMTIRALNTLNAVQIIAAEDTRHTQKLLNHFEIQTPTISCHEHNIQERIPQLVERMLKGDSVAQVSDAGMPSISDPGHELVKACIENQIDVVALPGANAAITALIASGLMPQPFYFYGFLDRKKSIQLKTLEQLKSREETLLFYESPFRVKETLANMVQVFHPNRQAVICRELTKRFEEYTRGTLEELVMYLAEHELKGEICLLVSGMIEEEQFDVKTEEQLPVTLSISEQVQWVMEKQALSQKEAIKWVAKQLNVPKQVVYKTIHEE